MSVWNCSHSIGAALAVVACGYIMGTMGTDMSQADGVVNTIIKNLTANGVDQAQAVEQAATYAAHIGAWKWCFYAPACLAVVTAFFVFLGLRDEPKEVGLPDLPDTGLGGLNENKKSAKARKKFEMEMVWKNRWVWTFCIANLFVYVVRMGVLDWGPKFLTELAVSTSRAPPGPPRRLKSLVSWAPCSLVGPPTTSSRAKVTACA